MDPVKIEIFKTDNGKEPFTEWIDSIRDQTTRDKILRRLRRVENGNVGSFKPLVTPNSICEFRFGFGAGYRIYFRFLSRSNILILCGGDKSSQKFDIKRAENYYSQYLENQQ